MHGAGCDHGRPRPAAVKARREEKPSPPRRPQAAPGCGEWHHQHQQHKGDGGGATCHRRAPCGRGIPRGCVRFGEQRRHCGGSAPTAAATSSIEGPRAAARGDRWRRHRQSRGVREEPARGDAQEARAAHRHGVGLAQPRAHGAPLLPECRPLPRRAPLTPCGAPRACENRFHYLSSLRLLPARACRAACAFASRGETWKMAASMKSQGRSTA